MDVSCLLPEARRTAAGLLDARAIKRLFLILALLGALVEIAIVFTSGGGTVVGQITPTAGLVALWIWWRQSCHRQRMPVWGDPFELALVALLAVTVGADATFGLLLIGIMYVLGRSLERYDAMQEQLTAARADRRMAAIVRHSSDIVTVLDADHRVRFQSPSVDTVLGYRADELVGSPLYEVLHPDDRQWVLLAAEEALAAGATDPIECRWRRRDGSYRLVQTIGANLLDDPDVSGIVLTTRDVTERRALEDELKHRAFHDSLTGLPNRAHLEDRLGRSLDHARRGLTAPALVLLDLDGFKAVNDSLGHAAGDRLLVAMAERLAGVVRDPDVVARLGGDEFALILHAAGGEAEVVARIDAVLADLARPFTVDGRELRIAASAGFCLPDGPDGPEELLRNADLALYRSKAAGKGRVARYEPRLHEAALESLEVEAELRTALDHGELELHYQPLYTAEREIAGIEALLRWRHPSRGLLAPGAFLEVAERSGLIVPMGRWVLREACQRGTEWSQRHPRLGQIGIGVNVSAEQLRDPTLIDDVRGALAESGLAPGRLTLEITETVLMQDLALAAATLQQIKALGVKLALDDFGTGYSSLAYLQRLPLDFLKIPRPFISALDTDEHATDLARGIVQLGASLGLRVVAEGVETEEQRRQVHAIGCSLVQGYLLSRPVPACELDALLARRAGAARVPA